MSVYYQVVFFDITKAASPLEAVKLSVTEEKFRALNDDLIAGVTLQDISYAIVAKRCFETISALFGHVFYLVIDIKTIKNEPGNNRAAEPAHSTTKRLQNTLC